jgi:hypothetical protein
MMPFAQASAASRRRSASATAVGDGERLVHTYLLSYRGAHAGRTGGGEHRSKPFVFGEWAMWDGDNLGFVSGFFGWIRSHERTKMMLYNQGGSRESVLRFSLDLSASKAIRGQLTSSCYLGAPAGS